MPAMYARAPPRTIVLTSASRRPPPNGVLIKPSSWRQYTKDTVMERSEVFNAIYLTDEFYRILIQESNILLTVASSPCGMLWERIFMLKGCKMQRACVIMWMNAWWHKSIPALSYFDDIFVQSHWKGPSAIKVLKLAFLSHAREQIIRKAVEVCLLCHRDTGPRVLCKPKWFPCRSKNISSICLGQLPTTRQSCDSGSTWLIILTSQPKITRAWPGHFCRNEEKCQMGLAFRAPESFWQKIINKEKRRSEIK